MKTEKINSRFSVLALMIVLAAFSRIIPHMPNLSPLDAIGLFGAAYFRKKWQAFLIPLSAVWLSDLFINNVIYAQYYHSFTWFYEGFYWQYEAYILITLFGLGLFRKVNATRVIGGAMCSSLIFFFISNYSCWPGNPNYSQNINGLLSCYAAGIPYYKGTLLGDLLYAGILFGGFALVQSRIPALRSANV
jgi:hypothetical protein